ncbi:MAG: hypothetical protein HY644_02945 [Acidobacteria bacterium]|nr:hypothetical protein [Acidobacteriota bacterium]
MTDNKAEAKKISMTSTKQEMLDAYNTLLKQLQEKRQTELKPEQRVEEKKVREAIKVADSLSTEGVVKEISSLRLEVGKMLAQLSDRLEEEVHKYQGIQQAFEIKQQELKEVYEIERSAATLAALIEAQRQKQEGFEAEMASRKEALQSEIDMMRAEWKKEKELRDLELKEQLAAEAKRREREKEEYQYVFKREQRLTKDSFEDEKARLEKDIALKKEAMEKELAEREKVLSRREEELNELRARVNAFPKEMEKAVGEAVREATARVQVEAKNREELSKKEFEGERKVLATRIESLEQGVKEQNEQIAKLSQRLEKAYQQVQDIAVKAVESSSNSKSISALQQLVAEQSRKQPPERER